MSPWPLKPSNQFFAQKPCNCAIAKRFSYVSSKNCTKLRYNFALIRKSYFAQILKKILFFAYFVVHCQLYFNYFELFSSTMARNNFRREVTNKQTPKQKYMHICRRAGHVLTFKIISIPFQNEDLQLNRSIPVPFFQSFRSRSVRFRSQYVLSQRTVIQLGSILGVLSPRTVPFPRSELQRFQTKVLKKRVCKKKMTIL